MEIRCHACVRAAFPSMLKLLHSNRTNINTVFFPIHVLPNPFVSLTPFIEPKVPSLHTAYVFKEELSKIIWLKRQNWANNKAWSVPASKSNEQHFEHVGLVDCLRIFLKTAMVTGLWHAGMRTLQIHTAQGHKAEPGTQIRYNQDIIIKKNM